MSKKEQRADNVADNGTKRVKVRRAKQHRYQVQKGDTLGSIAKRYRIFEAPYFSQSSVCIRPHSCSTPQQNDRVGN